MAKNRFALIMEDGAEVRNIDDLRAHFDIGSVVRNFSNGKLLTWLEDRYYDEEAAAIKALSPDDYGFQKKLCEIFGQETPEEIERRIQRLKRLKTFTDDKKILANVDKVAFDQEELADLLDEGADEIYLCANRFVIPLRMKNKIYIGVKDAIAVLGDKNQKDFAAVDIKFKNVSFEELPQKKAEASTVIKKNDVIDSSCLAIFVKAAKKFKSEIKIRAKGSTVDAKSILKLIPLELKKRNKITIAAEGNDADEAVAALKEVIDSGFIGASLKEVEDYSEATITIKNELTDFNLILLWQKAKSFQANVQISANYIIDAKNISDIVKIHSNNELTIAAEGSDAKQAVTALKKLIDSDFPDSAGKGSNLNVAQFIINQKTRTNDDSAMAFFRTAKNFKSKISFRTKGYFFDAKILTEVLIVSFERNSEFIIIAEGEDSKQAVAALKKLFDSGFPDPAGKNNICATAEATVNRNPKSYYGAVELLIETAKKFKAKIWLCSHHCYSFIAAESDIIAEVGFFEDTTIKIAAEGSDATQAVSEIKKLIDSDFPGAKDVERSRNMATTVIQNKTGICARLASVFVQKASSFKSKVQLKAKGKTVDAKSILMIMSMGLVKGTVVTIIADGPDAQEAVDTLKKIIDDKFGYYE